MVGWDDYDWLAEKLETADRGDIPDDKPGGKAKLTLINKTFVEKIIIYVHYTNGRM